MTTADIETSKFFHFKFLENFFSSNFIYSFYLKAKSPSLSDEHFISSVEQATGDGATSQVSSAAKKSSPPAPVQVTPSMTTTPRGADQQQHQSTSSKPPLTPCTPLTAASVSMAETSGTNTDYDDEYDDNDDAFDKSATLKANGVNNASSVHHNNNNNMANAVLNNSSNGRLLSDGEWSSSHEKMINRFNSDKSIYYSSVFAIYI